MASQSPFNGLPVTHDFLTAHSFKIVLTALVALSYILWVVALALIIWRGYKLKTYGMPAISLVSMLSICFLAGFVGPWVDEQKFFSPDQWQLVWTWRLWWVELLIIFAQFILYGWNQIRSPLQPYFYMYVLVSVMVAGLTQWTFIIFFQDYYVNIACPLLCVLPMAVGYLTVPFVRSDLHGLSIAAAWLLTIGTTFLYLSVVLNDMSAPYPGHESTGYGFLYWVFGFTIILFYASTIILVQKTRALRAALAITAGGA
jgi:hypothetical protein